MGVLALGLLISVSAWGAATVQTLFNGNTLSVRSGDGCILKPAPPASGRKYVRNFTCTITGTPGTPPAAPAAPRIQTLFNGDTVSVRSGDGCIVKPRQLSAWRMLPE